MTDHGAAYHEGWYRAYRVVNGRYRLYVGPKFDTPSGAARYARLLDEMPDTSPLRDRAEVPTVHHVDASAGPLND